MRIIPSPLFENRNGWRRNRAQYSESRHAGLDVPRTALLFDPLDAPLRPGHARPVLAEAEQIALPRRPFVADPFQQRKDRIRADMEKRLPRVFPIRFNDPSFPLDLLTNLQPFANRWC